MPLTTDQLIAQSKAMLAQTAAEGTKAFTGSSYDTVKPTNPTITAASLAPQTPIQPVTPTETPIPDLSYLAPPEPTLPNPANTPSTLGTTETQYKNMLAELMGTNTALEGKAGYTAQQNEALGVNAASDAITGLNSQLTGLINESKAIPLQIQQSAQEGGANVTKGGLAPIQTASLRNNAIQSLSVSSQIDAMNGQLSNAIKKVDRAVALKYGDLEARSATLTKNLELLAKDPSLTLEQQDRVAKKLVEQKAYDAQLADQKQTETETHDARLKVLSNNTGNPKLTQQIIEVLQSAQTPEEVAALVNYYGLSVASQADQLDMKVKQAQLDKANYDLAHPNRQTQVIQGNNGNTLLIDTNTGATIKDYGSKEPSPSDASGTMPVTIDGQTFEANADLVAYAQKYASGESVSPAELKLAGITMGQVAELAKALPKPNGTLIDNNTGVKPKTLSPTQEAGITAMNEIVTQTMPSLQDRFGKIATGVLGGLGGMVWTSQDRQDYDTFRQEFLSKLLVARSGAAVTEQEYERYAKMLPSNFNQAFFLGSDGGKKLKSLSSSMQTNLDNLTKTQQVSIVGYTDVKEDLSKLSPEQKAELEKEGLLPAWAK